MAGLSKSKSDWLLEKITEICIEELDGDFHRVLKRAGEENPGKYLDTVGSLMEYVTPKLSRVESDMQLTVPISIQLKPASEQDLLTTGNIINIDAHTPNEPSD